MSLTTPLHCIYASTSGNVEAVVERIGSVLTKRGHEVVLHRAEQTSPDVITDNRLFLLATSTWEHGALNPFFGPLYGALKTMDVSHKSAAFVGLGDRRYEPVLFCEGMEKLRKAWLAQGGLELLQPLRIQGEPYAILDKIVDPWVAKFEQQMVHDGAKEPSVLGSIKKFLAHG